MNDTLATVSTPAPATAITVTSRATIMRGSLEADSEQRALLKEYVNRNMVRDVDFGVIPGTPKPTLLKPGAEKLVDLFRCEPSYTITHRVEDWDRNLFHYEFRVQLKARDSGYVYAEGFGSCNSREGRYRWRKGERTCPQCGEPAIIRGKAEYGGGFVCFAKKGGCNAKFKIDDPAIADQPDGKVENDDIATQVNTILKMAKKRALVDASIALARCSDMFTQDVEDMGDHEPRERAPSNRGAARELRSTVPVERAKAESKAKATEPFRFGSGECEGMLITDVPMPYLQRLNKHKLTAPMRKAVDGELARRNTSEYIASKLQESVRQRDDGAGFELETVDGETGEVKRSDPWNLMGDTDANGNRLPEPGEGDAP